MFLRACGWGLELLTVPGALCPSALSPASQKDTAQAPRISSSPPAPRVPACPRNTGREADDQGPSGLCGGCPGSGPGSGVGRGPVGSCSGHHLPDSKTSLCVWFVSQEPGSPAQPFPRTGWAPWQGGLCTLAEQEGPSLHGGGGACRAGLEPRPNDISCARSTPGKEGGCFWRRAAGGQAPRVCPHQALGSKGGTPCLGPWLCLSGDSSRKEEWPHLGVEQSPRRGPALPALCGPGQACPCVQVCDRRGQSRSAGDTASLGCLTRGGQSPRPCWEGGEGDS